MNNFYQLKINIKKQIDRYTIQYTKKNLNIFIDEVKIFILEKGYRRMLILYPEEKNDDANLKENNEIHNIERNYSCELDSVFSNQFDHLKHDFEIRNTFNIWKPSYTTENIYISIEGDKLICYNKKFMEINPENSVKQKNESLIEEYKENIENQKNRNCIGKLIYTSDNQKQENHQVEENNEDIRSKTSSDNQIFPYHSKTNIIYQRKKNE